MRVTSYLTIEDASCGQVSRPQFVSPAQVTHFWAFFTSAYREGGDYERNNVPKDAIIYRCTPFFVDLALLRLARREEYSHQENNLGYSEIHGVKKMTCETSEKSNICRTSQCPDLLVSFQGAPNSGGCSLVLFHPSAAQVLWYRRYVCHLERHCWCVSIVNKRDHRALSGCGIFAISPTIHWRHLRSHMFSLSWSATQSHTTLNFILQK